MRHTPPGNSRKSFGAALLLGVLAVLGTLVIVLGQSIIPPTTTTSDTALQEITAVPSDLYPIVPTWTPGPTIDVPTAVIASRFEPYPIQPTLTPSIPPVESPRPTPQPSDPIWVHSSPMFGEWKPEDLAAGVPLVVVADVTKVYPSRWTTPDGLRPENPWSSDNVHQIYTPVEITVTEFVKGSHPTTQIMLNAAGGMVGQDRYSVDPPYTVFNEGERVLLFLQPDRRNMSFQNIPLLEVSFRYTISPDGKLMNYPEEPSPSLDEAIRAIKAAAP